MGGAQLGDSSAPCSIDRGHSGIHLEDELVKVQDGFIPFGTFAGMVGKRGSAERVGLSACLQTV